MADKILQMTRYVIALLLVCGVWLNVHAEGVVVDEIGIEQQGTNLSFVFTVDDPLSLTNSQWHPDIQSLQPNLGEMVGNGASHVAQTKQLTNSLKVLWVSLRRLPIRKKQLLASGLSSNQIENTWFLESMFYGANYGDDEKAAMIGIYASSVSFLDGAFAKEQPTKNQKKVTHRTPAVPNQRDASKGPPAFGPRRHEMTGENPWAKLMQPNFQLSTTTWNCLQDPFPLDIPKEINECRQFLSQQDFTFTNLNLMEIKMYPFAADVLLAHGLGLLSPQIHWLTMFEFEEKAEPLKRVQVHMLLDGRIVGYYNTYDDRLSQKL